MKEWFERGGFLYDITKEYGRLRNNSAALLDEISINLKGLNEDEAKFISCRIPESVESVNPFECVYQYTWGKNENCVQDEKRKLELKSFANINFAYKLPDDWEDDLEKDENLLLRYIVSQWGVGNEEGKKKRAYMLYWPENEQLHYPIFEIIKNYPKYNGWECVPKASNSAVKWLLQKPNSEDTLTTDIASSKFSLPFPENFINSIKFENKDSTDAFLKKRKHKGIMKSLKKEGAEGATALLRVLYTIGNIIPAGANYKPGRGAAKDTFYDKLTVIKNAIYLPKVERKNKISKDDKPKLTNDKINDKRKIENDEAAILLLDRLGYFKPEDAKKNQKIWNDFIKDHYLQDFVERENDNYTDPIKTDNPADLAKRIIQRGYRIYYQYERDNDGNIKYKDGQPKINSKLFNNNYSFTDYSKGYLAAIFESVGIPDDNLNLI